MSVKNVMMVMYYHYWKMNIMIVSKLLKKIIVKHSRCQNKMDLIT